MKIKRMCNKCGFHQDKCRCSEMKSIQPTKKSTYERHKVLSTYKWKKKRAYIKKRDGYFCQRCWHVHGKLNYEKLEVHHIKNRHDYPELVFEDSNLITICGDCNKFYRGQNELDFEWEPPLNNIDENNIIL